MASIGELMVKIGADISNFNKGMSQVDKKMKGSGSTLSGSMKGTSSSIGSSMSNIVGSVKGMIGAFAGAATVVGGFNIGKTLVEASADAQAMNAQFDQVFGDLSTTAQGSIDDIAKEVGMLPNRIKPQFTQFTSMFKGLGYDTQESMKMAGDAMMLAADASAFYDMSMEDSVSAMNSFIKGNYEGGESIGLFASETQMAAYASDKLGKDWKTLDEAGKQLVRMEYAKSMQESAGATGQASRESESYQNKLGNLKSAWAGLMAKMGEPLLDPVIKTLGFLTDIITSIDFGKIGDSFKAMATKFSEGTGGVVSFGEIFKSVKEVISTAVSTVVAFVQSKLEILKTFWQQNGSQILQAVTNAFNMIKAVISFVMPAVLFVVKYVWNAIKGVITGALNIIMGVVKIFTGLFTGNFSKMWEGVKQLFTGAIQFIWNWMSLTFVGGLRKLVVSLSKSLVATVKGMWESVRLWFMYGKDAAVKLMGTMGKGLLNLMKSAGSGLVNIAKGLWNSIKGIFTSLRTGAINIFQALKSGAVAIWNSIKSAVVNSVTSLKTSAVNMASKLKDGIVDKFKAVLSTAKTVFSNIKSAITSPIETAKNTVMGIIDKIKSAFSNMKIKIPTPSLPSISVGSKSFMDGKVKIPTFKVNWNAKGAIFNQASILGGGQGVGEAGAEAVIPIQHKRYMAPFARAVADNLPQNNQVVAKGDAVYTFTIPVVVDGREIAKATAQYTEAELEKLKVRKGRQGGNL